MLKANEQRAAARKFAADWKGRGYEKGESQSFWLSLLRDVFGVEHPEAWISFENQVQLNHTSFIDGYIANTKVLIEQKSINKDLRATIKQSDGSLLNPFQQAKRYAAELPLSKHPRWVVTCNFRSFLVYDMERPSSEPEEVLLENLEKEYYRLAFLTNTGSAHLQREYMVSIQAGELVGKLYDELLKQYAEPESSATLHALNVLCVRLVFCLYAEDAGVFPQRNMFHDYLAAVPTGKMRKALVELFRILDTPQEQRDRYEEPELLAFPYVNGGLFANALSTDIPQLNDEIRQLLLDKASHAFDWSEISPTIFGAVFESTLNPETRRSGGMHYTSIENIHRVIDPLFLDELQTQLEDILTLADQRKREQKLRAFQKHIAQLQFLDPACGSGNFLTETYLSIRRLENRVLESLHHGQMFFDQSMSPIQVSIGQFHGIEINDFAVTVATTALWIAESQMLNETERIIGTDIDFLPLKSYASIAEGNALRMDWNEVVPAAELDYIMGNPPFTGARIMSKEQKADLENLFADKNVWKNIGNLDYVCGWYKKAMDLMIANPAIRSALVSTNSITQGEQVPLLWKPLCRQGLHIDFAYRTFRWDSEAKIKAHVHCVIVGFCMGRPKEACRLFVNEQTVHECRHINGYLMEMDDIFIESRKKPLADVPEIGIGNQPIDGGFYLFTEEERDEFIKQEPKAVQYFKPWYGAQEFINNRPRYCLWLGKCSPAELRSMPHCMKRIEAVRNYRLESTRASTYKLADTPTHFQTENMPDSNYILVPRVSSERRRYVPMGFLSPEKLTSDAVQIIPSATLYHFGVLTSNVHMAWMRAFAGRLKSDYRYSKDIVYNNFPWPTPTEAQRTKIEQTAQAILNARSLYPDSSLADLYDEVTMPPELRKAHQQNDRAVMEAYGMAVKDTTEESCVARLMELYRSLT